MDPIHYYVKTLDDLETFLGKHSASLRIKKVHDGWTVELLAQGRQPVVQNEETFAAALNRAVGWFGNAKQQVKRR